MLVGLGGLAMQAEIGFFSSQPTRRGSINQWLPMNDGLQERKKPGLHLIDRSSCMSSVFPFLTVGYRRLSGHSADGDITTLPPSPHCQSYYFAEADQCVEGTKSHKTPV